MYFFNSDGSIISCTKNDMHFGWWFKDINVIQNNHNISDKFINNNISVEKVVCVQHQEVCLNICYDCGKYEKNNIYIPPVENIVEFIHENISKEMLLLGILHPVKWRQLNSISMNENQFNCNKFNKNVKFEATYNNCLKLYNDKPASTLFSKLSEIDKLLKSFKKELHEMRQTLDDLKNYQDEEDKNIDSLIKRTLHFTQDYNDTQYLEGLVKLLQNKHDVFIVKDWPFDFDTGFIGYSANNRNYII